MKKLEKQYIESYDGREGCLATIVILAAFGAAVFIAEIIIVGIILSSELIKSIQP